MKKYFVILFIMLFLVGCGQQYVCPDGSVVEDKSMCPQEKVKAIEPETQEEPKNIVQEPETQESEIQESEQIEVNEELEELLQKSQSVSSLAYTYDGETSFKVKVSRQYMKIFYSKLNDNEYTAIYFDKQNKKAYKVCEGLPECMAMDETSSEIDYESNYYKTPFDRLSEIKAAAEIIEERQCDTNKNCKIIEFSENGKTIQMGLWDYKGIPLFYKEDGKEELYQDLAYNSVKDNAFNFLKEV